ncbi:hypothetical protein ACS0TY_016341 [Phlomoides rotata]
MDRAIEEKQMLKFSQFILGCLGCSSIWIPHVRSIYLRYPICCCCNHLHQGWRFFLAVMEFIHEMKTPDMCCEFTFSIQQQHACSCFFFDVHHQQVTHATCHVVIGRARSNLIRCRKTEIKRKCLILRNGI